jgi:predicted ATP-grasp superfamily ATP-dependent carboligase
MKILAYEHFTALGEAAPPALRREGGAMLRALTADLWRAGHDVVTVAGSFRSAARRVDAVWIVAPETAGRLERLTRAALAAGARVLGSEPAGIRLAASKWRTAAALRRAGVPVVPTRRLGPLVQRIASGGNGGGLQRDGPGGPGVRWPWSFPLVAKPDDGVGCDAVRLARGPADLVRRRAPSARGRWVVQPRVRGTPASVAVLVGPGAAVPLALASQRVLARRRFTYAGGEVPLRRRDARQAREVAVRACRAIPGLAGYVGVDLMLTSEGPLVLEVNPRLTTSYLGLRAATRANVAAAAIAALEGRSPGRLRFSRRVRFDAGGAVADR